MYPYLYAISPYIVVCYVSKLFILFLMCQNFLLYFIISFMYVYVSAFVYYFTVHINHVRYVSILICYFTIHCCMLCVHVFSLFHHIAMFMCPRYLHYFTIHYVFMYPCFCSISPYILIIYVMYPYYSHYFTT